MSKIISVIIAAAMCICFILPVTAGEERKRISTIMNQGSNIDDIEAEITFGRELAARILGNYPLLEDDVLTRYVNLVGRGIALYSGRPELKFYFGILDSDEVNAFAAPGGYIFVTKAALMKMENEAQLAAVLGHEIAHVVEKHVIRELNIRSAKGTTASGITSLISGTTGSVKGALEKTLENATDILFKKGYKIEDEIEADRTGMLIISAAGYNPLALKIFLTHTRQFEKGDQKDNKGHPVYEERMKYIEDTLFSHGLGHAGKAKVRERFYEYVKN